jgi:hypothetical protein
MFNDFMDSDEAWAACEQYWEHLIHEIEVSLGQVGSWQEWGSNRWANGTLMDREFRKMSSRRSPTLARGLQIYQEPLADAGSWLTSWMKRDDDVHAEVEDWPSASLVISLALEEDTAHLARKLIEKWLKPDTTPDAMEDLTKLWSKPTTSD